MRGCACGDRDGVASPELGVAHVSRLAEQAKLLYAEATEDKLGGMVQNKRWARWHKCSLCDQDYHGVVACALGWVLHRAEMAALRRWPNWQVRAASGASAGLGALAGHAAMPATPHRPHATFDALVGAANAFSLWYQRWDWRTALQLPPLQLLALGHATPRALEADPTRRLGAAGEGAGTPLLLTDPAPDPATPRVGPLTREDATRESLDAALVEMDEALGAMGPPRCQIS